MKVKDVEFLTQQENGRMQDDISSIKYDDKTPKIKLIEGKTCHPFRGNSLNIDKLSMRTLLHILA
jgi:hypothetical protein